ncbi:iron ABC transporter permease [Salicibibacter cibi]|uniref:Iron ABC transporter permease n=1 Tax=Salicibibacter cibi TaxID=2743001 RepID=A0A7T6ZAT9_9BACI|nr:iron ABC transporter permease [Salicibibacter cibi]QQK80017.1 iron ABC transporter permease [Salicibibacter cibi]
MKRTIWIYVAIVGLIICVFLLSLQMGTMTIAPLDVWRTMMGEGTDQHALVLFEFRLPRMVTALLVGAGLAISGAILQSLSRNELADPGILGINAGAGLAVVLFIYFFQGSSTSLGETVFALPIFAFVGALTAAFLIYTLAWKKGVTPIRLVLVGIGLNAGFTAILIVFQLRMNPDDFMQATVWLNGDIWGTSWTSTLAVLPWMLLLIPLVMAQARNLNVMRLGDPSAVSLGIKVERTRRRLLVWAVMLAGASVSVGGAISFLGLVAPHIARRLVGPRHQVMIPTAAMMGALILLFADMVGRNLLSPSEIPVGIVVAVIGAPYFLYLLMKTP